MQGYLALALLALSLTWICLRAIERALARSLARTLARRSTAARRSPHA